MTAQPKQAPQKDCPDYADISPTASTQSNQQLGDSVVQWNLSPNDDLDSEFAIDSCGDGIDS